MSLADKIALLTNPTPEYFDPEDEEVDKNTSAKVVQFDDSVNDTADETDPKQSQRSILRLRNASLLSDADSRYAGIKTSRQRLRKLSLSGEEAAVTDSEDDDGDDSDDLNELRTQIQNRIVSSEEDQEDDDADTNLLEFRAKLKGANVTSNDSETHFNEDDESDEVDDEDESEVDDEDRSDDDDEGSFPVGDANISGEETIQTFSKINLDDEIDKGKAVKAQLKFWDTLLELRIKLQKVLLTANQLPQYDVWPFFLEKTAESDFKDATIAGQNSVKSLLDSLIELQSLALSRNAETKKILLSENDDAKNQTVVDDDDEEIPSDTEDEDAVSTDEGKPKVGLKRKLDYSDYPEFLKKRHNNFTNFRNKTIQRWNDRTNVAAGKIKKSFSSFEQSTLKQIEQILCDKGRLIRRTQLKRSVYELLGKNLTHDVENEEEHQVSGQEAVLKHDSHLKDYDVEIFDDSDFYHQLLRELIERKTLDIQDPVALGRQWLQIQKLRSKIKRKVDTKASKGRRVRYDVHSKLVNFMAPYEQGNFTEEARDDLFKSLFK